MLNALFQAVRGDDPYEQLISAIINIERQPQAELKLRRAEAERLKGVLNDFDSSLSSLHAVLESLTDVVSNPFEARTASVSEGASFRVTASEAAGLGTHTVQVERLARTDTRISDQLTAGGTSLRSFFDTNGAQTFSIEVATPSGATSRTAIDVTVDPTGTTDAEILAEIATAIDEAMSTAVTDGTLRSTERAYASVVNETSDTARLSLRSGQTGFTHRLSFVDSGAGLLAQIGLSNNALAAGTTGGQVTLVGTSETDSELNSKFTLDGLTLYRDTNQVSDALPGITLTLEGTDTRPYDFSVSPDATSITSEIQNFIERYNEVLGFIEGKARVDGENDVRGDFAGETAFTALRFNMRTDLANAVPSASGDGPAYLSDIGITINNDGTLELTDEDALLAAVEQDAGAVQRLFAGPDGFATRLLTRIDGYVSSNGVLDNRLEVMDNRIQRLNDRIAEWDDRLAQREAQLRQEYARIQEIIGSLQSQQQSFLSFFA
ncbi:flagellar hook protein FliD [Rhodothermaceae bacterium RA]|nr:flagellar hook protein FliD [Rhodothermaceae bacterium RA]